MQSIGNNKSETKLLSHLKAVKHSVGTVESSRTLSFQGDSQLSVQVRLFDISYLIQNEINME